MIYLFLYIYIHIYAKLLPVTYLPHGLTHGGYAHQPHLVAREVDGVAVSRCGGEACFPVTSGPARPKATAQSGSGSGSEIFDVRVLLWGMGEVEVTILESVHDFDAEKAPKVTSELKLKAEWREQGNCGCFGKGIRRYEVSVVMFS